MKLLVLLLASAATLAAPAPITFTNVTAQAGIHFTHNAGRAGKRWPDILLNHESAVKP